MSDAINPQHYKRLDPEPITVIERWGLSFCIGNAVKYLSRAGHKQGVDAATDLAKARWYIERAALPTTAGELQEMVVSASIHREMIDMAAERTEALRADVEHWERLAKQLGDRVRVLEVQLVEAGMTELRDARAEVARPNVLLQFDHGDLGGEG